MSRTVFPPPPAGCHRTVLLQCGLPRTGNRGGAEPCDLFFALAPRSHDHQGDSRRQEVGYAGGEDEEMWGSMGGGRVSEGKEGGEVSTTTAPNPPPPSEAQPPPNPPPRNESFLWSRPTKATTGHPPAQKAQTPHHHHHCTAYEGRPRPQTHQPPQDRHRNPPPPPTKTDTPKGAEKKDNRHGDPIVGTVVHVPYPNGAERGTIRGIRGRKYGAVWVEYPGGTTLYEVSRSLLFPTPEEAERHREQARGGGQEEGQTPHPHKRSV